MNNADEIEYFEFVPIFFIKELHEEVLKEVENRICEISLKGVPDTPHTKKHALEIISTSMSKNFFLFQNFVVKTIFSFPSSFSFERKLTDLRCEANLQKLVDEFLQIIEEERYLRTETLRLEGEIEAEVFRIKQYEKLLGKEDEIVGVTKSINMLKKLFDDANRAYKAFIEKHLDKKNQEQDVIEFKCLRNEMYKKEKKDMYEKASADTLLFYIENI